MAIRFHRRRVALRCGASYEGRERSLSEKGHDEVMPKMTYEYKLPNRSIPEVQERFLHTLVKHQGSGKTSFRGRKLSGEVLVNAVMLRFLDLTVADQAKILAVYVPRFEVMLDTEVADDDVGESACPDMAIPKPVVEVDRRSERADQPNRL